MIVTATQRQTATASTIPQCRRASTTARRCGAGDGGRGSLTARRNRLDVEAWVDAQLRDLYGLPGDNDLPLELDLDEINAMDGPKRAAFIKARPSAHFTSRVMDPAMRGREFMIIR